MNFFRKKKVNVSFFFFSSLFISSTKLSFLYVGTNVRELKKKNPIKIHSSLINCTNLFYESVTIIINS